MRELSESRGRDFTERYRELIDHYGLRAARNFPGNAGRTAQQTATPVLARALGNTNLS
jgi:hypothetical protein